MVRVWIGSIVDGGFRSDIYFNVHMSIQEWCMHALSIVEHQRQVPRICMAPLSLTNIGSNPVCSEFSLVNTHCVLTATVEAKYATDSQL